MRFLLPLRTHPATWLLLPALALTALYAATEGNPTDVRGYWVGAVSSATAYTVFSCGFGSLAAAVDASRARRSQLFRLAPARSSLHVAVASLWPTVLMSFIIQATGFFLIAPGNWGSPGRFPWEVLLAWLAMILFHVAVGYVIGMVLPLVAAAPAALLVSYVWLGFTWSVSYTPLRYLSGLAISGCCAVYSELAPQAIVAVVVFSSGGIVGAALVIGRQGTPHRIGVLRRFLLPALPVVAAAVVGLSFASGLGAYPSPPRAIKDLTCERTQIAEICFYPEQLWNVTPDPMNVAESALERIDDAGIPVPDRVSASLSELGDRDTLVFLYRRDFTAAAIAHSLSSWFGYWDPSIACPRDEGGVERPLFTSGVVTAVAYLHATGEPDPFEDAAMNQAAAALLAEPPEVQSDWMSLAMTALNDCSAPLPEMPVS